MAIPTLSGSASGQGSCDRDKLTALEGEIDALTAQVEVARGDLEELNGRIGDAEDEIGRLQQQNAKLQKEAIERATELYKAGQMEMVDALLGSKDFADLSTGAEMLSRVTEEDNGVFVELSRGQAQQERLQEQLTQDRERVEETIDAREAAVADQQRLFANAQDDYRECLAELQEETTAAPAPGPAPALISVKPTGDMACPVAGPTSFVDSWLAPRDGHLHQGVDMMAAYGTPLVAIVSGSITYSGYHGSAGNWLTLSGDNGHAYYYMHNQQNLVSGGHVAAGEQIGTVGDTGNAVGTPHLHFEYHPGGGSAVNPYPLVAAIC